VRLQDKRSSSRIAEHLWSEGNRRSRPTGSAQDRLSKWLARCLEPSRLIQTPHQHSGPRLGGASAGTCRSTGSDGEGWIATWCSVFSPVLLLRRLTRHCRDHEHPQQKQIRAGATPFALEDTLSAHRFADVARASSVVQHRQTEAFECTHMRVRACTGARNLVVLKF